MPGRDGTGPVGSGAMTGRGLGPCNETDQPRFGGGFRSGFGFGSGFGSGYGLGLGCRRGFGNRAGGWFSGPISEKTRKEMLKDQKDFLHSRLEAIDKQLEDL